MCVSLLFFCLFVVFFFWGGAQNRSGQTVLM